MMSELIKEFVDTKHYDAIFFMMMRTADLFFIYDGVNVKLEEIDLENSRIYVTWNDGKIHSHYIQFANVPVILQCINEAFGEKSHSYSVWYAIYLKLGLS